jgi:hypothetical protein
LCGIKAESKTISITLPRKIVLTTIEGMTTFPH